MPSIPRVRYSDSLQFEFAPAVQAEHICLESDEVVTVDRVRGARVGPSISIASRLRGCETQLALLDNDRLAIRARRPRRPRQDYVLDLRFINVQPVRDRRIAWLCWQTSVALAAVGASSGWIASVSGDPTWLQPGWLGSIGLLTAACCVGVLALYRTRETIQYCSLHGQALLLEIPGGLGCSRTAESFTLELARRITAARARMPQSRQQFLRDEMREHRRLHDNGVLSKDAYEAGKQRILQAHG